MKGGINLSVAAVILILLGLLVMVAIIYIIYSSTETVDPVIAQSALRICCEQYRLNGCSYTGVKCKFPGKDDTNMDVVAGWANIELQNLDDFCGGC